MQKTIYTLCVNDYAPQITELTFPLLKHHANKIGAGFHVITERKYPDWPITFEKFQVGELAQQRGDEWAIFFDADTLIDPEQFDVTNHLSKDTVAHNGRDFAGIRWKYDKYLHRDGRNIGSCTWCVICSDWCIDLWDKPDVELQTILDHIFITVGEHNSGNCKTDHLIDDYLLSRNIARFGLKFKTIMDVCYELGVRGPNDSKVSPWLWHKYTISNDVKVREMLGVLSTQREHPAFAERVQVGNAQDGSVIGKTADGRVIQPCGRGWGLMSQEQADAYRAKWGIK